uniref:Uncharacterized protein n=1 Tax=Oryza brachyantha TaxID=4533 RepID=J3MVV1_ORYBR
MRRGRREDVAGVALAVVARGEDEGVEGYRKGGYHAIRPGTSSPQAATSLGANSARGTKYIHSESPTSHCPKDSHLVTSPASCLVICELRECNEQLWFWLKCMMAFQHPS